MDRPELIYDATAAAQVFSKGEIINVLKKEEETLRGGKKPKRKKGRKTILAICQDL